MKKQEKMMTIFSNKKATLLLLLFVLIPKVNAFSGTFITDSKTIKVGDSTNVNITLTNSSDVQALSGIFASSDNNCVKINSVTPVVGDAFDDMFAYSTGNPVPSGTVIARANITGLKECSASINILEPVIVSTNRDEDDAKVISGTITVIDNKPQTQSTQSNTSLNTNTSNGSNITSQVSTSEIKQVNNVVTEPISNTSVSQSSSQIAVSNESLAVNENNEKKKEYNTDNYLLNIVPSVGILSPAFDMKKEKYIIYVPYEVEKITFETELSNKETSKVDVDGPEELKVGENKYVFKVTAESKDIREYIVTVKKFSNYELSSSNNNLKSITLRNNTLLNSYGQEIKFDKDTLVYYYKKGDDLSYSYVAEDETAIVRTFENGDTINIVVEALNGDVKIYNLLPYEVKEEKENKQSSLKYVLLFILGIFIGYLIKLTLVLIKRYHRKKSKLKKDNQI